MLAKSKLNGIEILTSQALLDLKISHEEFKTIVNKEENFFNSIKCLKLVSKNLLMPKFTQ